MTDTTPGPQDRETEDMRIDLLETVRGDPEARRLLMVATRDEIRARHFAEFYVDEQGYA